MKRVLKPVELAIGVSWNSCVVSDWKVVSA
jgi:hypothetical protein